MARQPSRLSQYGGITPEQAGRFVEERLRAKRITKRRLAELLGVHESYVSDLTAGRYDLRSNPERLRRIVTELGLTEGELLEGLGVQPLSYVSVPSSRYLGKLEGLPHPPPAGRPILLPPQFLGGHRPEDVFVIELGPGEFGVFSRTAVTGKALEHTRAHGYRVVERPRGEVLGRLVGSYRLYA